MRNLLVVLLSSRVLMWWLVGCLWHRLMILNILAFVGKIGMIPPTSVICVKVWVLWSSLLKSICMFHLIWVRLIIGIIMTKVALNTTHLAVRRGNIGAMEDITLILIGGVLDCEDFSTSIFMLNWATFEDNKCI